MPDIFRGVESDLAGELSQRRNQIMELHRQARADALARSTAMQQQLRDALTEAYRRQQLGIQGQRLTQEQLQNKQLQDYRQQLLGATGRRLDLAETREAAAEKDRLESAQFRRQQAEFNNQLKQQMLEARKETALTGSSNKFNSIVMGLANRKTMLEGRLRSQLQSGGLDPSMQTEVASWNQNVDQAGKLAPEGYDFNPDEYKIHLNPASPGGLLGRFYGTPASVEGGPPEATAVPSGTATPKPIPTATPTPMPTARAGASPAPTGTATPTAPPNGKFAGTTKDGRNVYQMPDGSHRVM